eukprot:9824237-Heterocapsa_arctica.AAC.1
MGVTETARFVRNFEAYIDEQTRFASQSAWFSRSIDRQNLNEKRAVVFSNATKASGWSATSTSA